MSVTARTACTFPYRGPCGQRLATVPPSLLNTVIDSTQTGARVRFDISEPTHGKLPPRPQQLTAPARASTLTHNGYTHAPVCWSASLMKESIMTAQNPYAFHRRPHMRRGLHTEVPLPTQLVSNEEFPPMPQTA